MLRPTLTGLSELPCEGPLLIININLQLRIDAQKEAVITPRSHSCNILKPCLSRSGMPLRFLFFTMRLFCLPAQCRVPGSDFQSTVTLWSTNTASYAFTQALPPFPRHLCSHTPQPTFSGPRPLPPHSWVLEVGLALQSPP